MKLTIPVSQQNVIIIEESDLSTIKELWILLEQHHDQIVEQPSSLSKYEERFHNWVYNNRTTVGQLFVATVNGVYVGYCYAIILDLTDDRQGCVAHLFVKKEYRHHDIGQKLIASAISWLKRNSNPKMPIVLNVMAGNENTFSFYTKCGFRLSGYRFEYER